jgi:hypothetical protein
VFDPTKQKYEKLLVRCRVCGGASTLDAAEIRNAWRCPRKCAATVPPEVIPILGAEAQGSGSLDH